MIETAALLLWLANTWPYHLAAAFVAFYPMFTSVMWTFTSLVFYRRNERHPLPIAASDDDLPFVSVLVAAYCEEAVIERTVESLIAMNYPRDAYEIVIVDDGSTDRTCEILAPYVRQGQIRLVRKLQNEGKAMALNDAFPLLHGEIVVVVDADIQTRPEVLRYMVPHFQSGRVAAVTGNPEVTNTDSLLAKIQATEFASIVSVLRRAQRVWRRILTVSGAITAFRKSAVVDVGLFDPEMATEDIALAWKLQRKFYDVRYEPRAVVATQVPEGLGPLWRQRKRWALGLGLVLRKHATMFADWRTRRLWPVYVEACLSILWAYTVTVMVLFWGLSYAVGLELLGASPLPNLWGMVIATAALLQLGTGIWLDRHYNPGVTRFFFWAVMYPMFYWIVMTFITVLATPRALFGKHQHVTRWQTPRVPLLSAREQALQEGVPFGELKTPAA